MLYNKLTADVFTPVFTLQCWSFYSGKMLLLRTIQTSNCDGSVSVSKPRQRPQTAYTALTAVHWPLLPTPAGNWKQRYGASQPASPAVFHPPGRHRAADCVVRPIAGPDVPYAVVREGGERTLVLRRPEWLSAMQQGGRAAGFDPRRHVVASPPIQADNTVC